MGNFFLWRNKSTYIFWYALFVASLKIFARKTQWEKNLGQGKKSATHIILPLIKTSLISCDDVSNIHTLWLVYSFSKKNHTFLEYGVSFISTRHTFDLLHGGLLFLHGNICLLHWSPGYYCASTCKHIACLIELYADQINILHLRNQSILSWIPRNRINP